MGIAIDTVLASVVNPGAAGLAAAVNGNGDSLTIRNSNSARKVYLEGLIRQGATAGFVGVRSPMLHDNVFGIRIPMNESPSVFTIPAEADQLMQPQDTLTVEVSGGAAETDLAALQIYYEDLPGLNGRYHNFSEISPLIKYIKPQRVAVASNATPGQWSDTLLTTTENVLHANTDYAILGYVANSAYAAVCVKGAATGNLRAGGPGATSELVTTNYFVAMNQRSGRPWIPVFNSADAGGFFVSVCAATASVAGIVTLMLAELSSPLPN